MCDRSEPGASLEQAFHLVGDLDLAIAQQVRARRRAAVLTSDGDLVVDATELEFIDSSGPSVLVESANRLAKRGRGLQTHRLSRKRCTPS